MTFDDMDCAFPATLKEALELLADEQTRGRLLAGGTDLMVQWESGVLPLPERAISVKHLTELQQIEEDRDLLRIGAGVTHMALRRSDLIQRYAPSLAEAAATVGGYQIQTMGTLGGSIANASPAGDLAPSLLIADSTVVLASARGEREIPVASFWTGYRQLDLQFDEMIVRFHLPKLPDGHSECWHKLGPRKAQAISKVMGSCRGCVVEGIVQAFTVALGSVAPTAVRLYDVEAWVTGRALDPDTLDEAECRVMDAIQPIRDIRSTAEYRKWVSGRLVRNFLETLSI